MTAMRPVLEFVIDANIVFLLAFCLWKIVQTVLLRSHMRTNYAVQLRLLKSALAVTLVSPILAFGAVSVSRVLWPETPLTVGDIAVAAYLRGDITLPALEFEALLNTRTRVLDLIFTGQSPWMAVLLWGLFAVAVLHVARAVWHGLRIRSALAGSHVWRRTKRVDIRLSDTVGVAFAARSLFRRHVVLPSSLVTHPRHMRFILAHECQHLREGDVEWELAFEALRPIMFLNPAFILWKRDFDRLRELSCDQSVIARRDIPFRDYSDCLLDFCQRRIAGARPTAMHVAFVRTGRRAARRDLEARILALHTMPDRERRHVALAVFSLVLMVGVTLAAGTVRQSGDWSHDRLMLSTIINLERLEAINGGFRY